MKFKIITIPPFDKQLKRLVKKYPSLKKEYANLITLLKTKPKQGVSLSNDCYKIRIGIKSKGKGKSGGARIVTHLQVFENNVFFLAIYDKSEHEDVTDKEIKYLLSFIQ